MGCGSRNKVPYQAPSNLPGGTNWVPGSCLFNRKTLHLLEGVFVNDAYLQLVFEVKPALNQVTLHPPQAEGSSDQEMP